MNSGIRQGCPLSPLIFAVVLDVFLRRLCRRQPRALCRAYADDLGVTVPELMSALPELQELFLELAAVAGLHVNIAKTALIPLFCADVEDIRREIARCCPGWAGIRITFSARYAFIANKSKGMIGVECTEARLK